MGHHRHPSRREILNSIAVLGGGSLLVPLTLLGGQKPDTRMPAVIKGKLTDTMGNPVPAKVRVTLFDGSEPFFPEHAIRTMPKKVGPNIREYFYARGQYEIAVPPGRYTIEVVRGLNCETLVELTEVGSGITHVHDFAIPQLGNWRETGWYSGNTHTHYHLEIDEDPDERLRIVPPAEALDVSVISYLIRNDSPYITNRYPIGRLPQFSRDGTIMDMGEEARNNRTFGGFGYGHCLFLNIPRAIEPVSTGLLSRDGKAPDFPTLSMLCDEAQRLGGTTVWCHNGGGMELPVAAALGNLNAFNVADGLDAEYARYYDLLNCGFRLPLSSGTDWWIYDHNRVYVKVEGSFSYDTWIAGLRAGRTFVTNGPLIDFTVDGQGPGATLERTQPGMVRVRARVLSRLPFDKIEVVQDGEAVAEQSSIKDREAWLEREIPVRRGGWLAVRVQSQAWSRGGVRVFGHTSPVYLRVAGTPFRRAEAAGRFIDEIEESKDFIRKSYKFASDADRAVAMGRFQSAAEAYAGLARKSGDPN
jgi:hypothetical protein